MLRFTHNHGKTQPNYENQQYQPVVIKNTSKINVFPHTKSSAKKIIKTHSRSQDRKKNQSKKNQKQFVNKQWDKNQKTGLLFDKSLKKDSLAAQERKQKAQVTKKKVEEEILKNQDKIYEKKVEAMDKEKDKEMERLKKIIEQQRAEKEKNDRLFEDKKKQIEKQRKQLLKLEQQIQRNGPKAGKEVKQKIREINREVYPGNDRGKCYPQIKSYQSKPQQFNEVTQSESIMNQKNKLRQQQLQYLVDQRERNHLQYKKNTLGYTPTLVPLLSKASYKIISTHVSTLVELLVDDLLEQQVYMLEKIELEEQAQKQKKKSQEMLNDYQNKLETFMEESEKIENRLGRYQQMKFEDIYLPRRAQSPKRSAFTYENTNLYQKLTLSLSYEQVEEIDSRKDRFKRFVSNFDEYKEKNVKMFEECTQQLIDQAVMRLAKELDNGSSDLVQIIFRNQFV